MPSALLVEFEGVVVDTYAARRDALVRALREEGVELGAAEYDERCAGRDVASAVRAAARGAARVLDETALDLAALRAERHFAETIGKGATLAPGARGFLDDAAGRTRLALVTRASRREVEFVLGLAALDAYFECVIAAGDAEPRPSPAPYERALDRLSRRRPVRAAEALALDDSALGARAARAAGVRCVVVGAEPDAANALSAADAAVATLEGETLQSLATLAGLAGLSPRPVARAR